MRHHSGGHARHFNRSGRDSNYYLYEEPDCTLLNGVLVCPSDTGALNSGITTVYPGWNVWDVYQVKDLDFSIMMVGVSRDRQLQIWVEDQVRLNAPGAEVADSVDLKGSQVEILSSSPTGLSVSETKEQAAPEAVVNGPADLRTVRFFNRGSQATMPWPHDDNYLLNETYVPTATNPATSGPPPTTIAQTVTTGVTAPVVNALKNIPPVFYIAGALGLGLYFLGPELLGKAKSSVRRIRSPRSSRSR